MSLVPWQVKLALRAAGGEPVDLWRTIASHGLVELPPMRVDEARRSLEVTVALRRGRPRTIAIAPADGAAVVSIAGPRPSETLAAELLDRARHVLRLDEDLSQFYAVAAQDPALAWATRGAGRMVRSQTASRTS
jgi:hypothetical protein